MKKYIGLALGAFFGTALVSTLVATADGNHDDHEINHDNEDMGSCIAPGAPAGGGPVASSNPAGN